MLTSLTLKNWRTHADTTLEFGKGTNVIIGVMGSGKSSIVNAISYSLFGTFPALKSKQVSLKEIIMNKPNQMSTAETILDFEQGGVKYRVERLIKMDGTNEGKLLENGKFISGPKQKDVNEKIEKILGMDYELFSRAVYAEQNEMDFFLKLSPGDRKKKFDELLQLERYETARKNSNTLQNELLKESKIQEKIAQQQKEMLKNHEEEKLSKQILEIEKEIKELQIKVEVSKKENVEIEKEYKTLSSKEQKHKEIEEKIAKTRTRIESINEDIKQSDGLTLTDIINKISDAKNNIGIIKVKQETLEKKIKEKDREIKTLKEEIKVIEYKIKELENEIKGISILKGKCPTCKKELDETHKSELIENCHKKMQEALVDKKKLEESVSLLVNVLNKSEKDLANERKLLDNESKNLYTLEANEKRAKETENKKKLLTELKYTLPTLETELKETGFNKKELENIREKYYTKRNEIELISSQISSKIDLKKSYENTLSKIENIKKSIELAENESVKLSIASKKMGVFSNCLMATQGELRGSMLETINTAMTNIWSAIYPYLDFIDARLSVTTDGYDLEVKTRSNTWVRVEGILSGGERSAAALCIRMAFALVLTKNLSMLVLDEPTHNLDSNAVSKLSEMLRIEMPKLVEQIFVITHEKELESAASSNLYLLQRNKDSDEATQVEVMPIM